MAKMSDISLCEFWSDQRVQREHREKEEKQKATREALNHKLDNVELCLEIDTMRAWSNSRLEDQLDWHRRWHRQQCGKKCPETHQIPSKTAAKNKQPKLDALVATIDYYRRFSTEAASGSENTTVTPLKISDSMDDDFLTSEMTLDDAVMYG